MKSYLMFKDQDFCVTGVFTPGQKTLIEDLSLDILFDALSEDDKFTRGVVSEAIMNSLKNKNEILYRQAVLKDTICNRHIVNRMYDIVLECINAEHEMLHVGLFSRYPSSVLSNSLTVLVLFFSKLAALRKIAEHEIINFQSEGFSELFLALMTEVNDDYLAKADKNITLLRTSRSIKMSAWLGPGNIGNGYTLRKPPEVKPFWRALFARKRARSYTVRLAERDQAGARIFSELGDRGIVLIANALSQSVNHILHFLQTLRTELAFYLAGARLYNRLQIDNIAVCFPMPYPPAESILTFNELTEAILAITMPGRAVSNSLKSSGHNTFIITGANQGGKSTWLRGLSIAYLMMQCGMFVCARQFSSNIANGIFSHFRQEEDVTLRSGKLDEELSRMNHHHR